MPKITQRKLCVKCNSFFQEDRCPNCTKQDNKTYSTYIRAKDRQKIYNCTKWKTVRELALLRDELMCVHCRDKNVFAKADCVHHIVYLEDDITLAYELGNLVSLCDTCHMQVHSNDHKRDKKI